MEKTKMEKLVGHCLQVLYAILIVSLMNTCTNCGANLAELRAGGDTIDVNIQKVSDRFIGPAVPVDVK